MLLKLCLRDRIGNACVTYIRNALVFAPKGVLTGQPPFLCFYIICVGFVGVRSGDSYAALPGSFPARVVRDRCVYGTTLGVLRF